MPTKRNFESIEYSCRKDPWCQKKNGTGGEEAQRGRKVTHEKEKGQPFVAEAKWKIYGDPCPLSLRPVGPIRDLFFVVFLHLTSPSQTWPTVCSLHLKDQGKIFTSRINSHFVLRSVVKFSLPIFFSFVSNLLCFKSLDSKGTRLEIELNLAWILVMDFQNTLKFVWLQIKKLGNGPAFLMLTKSCLAVFGSLKLSYIQLTRFPSPTTFCAKESGQLTFS